MKADLDILYYACGGGMGHITRATAILRQLRRNGITELLAVVNATNTSPLEQEGLPYLHLTERDPKRFREQVAVTLEAYQPHVLVVDAFPNGIVGELPALLPSLPCRTMLVYRHLREPYRRELPAAAFDLFLCAEGPIIEMDRRQYDCEPVLIRDADELLPRAEARRKLGVTDDAPVVLGVGCGEPEWDASVFGLLEKIWRRRQPLAHLRQASLTPAAGIISHYPLLELFNGVDLLVGAGGYNLAHEARACGVPALFLPRARRYDDQQWRAGSDGVDSPEALEARIMASLTALTPRPASAYNNGASRAAGAIAELLAR